MRHSRLGNLVWQTGKPAVLLAILVSLCLTPVSKAAFAIRSRRLHGVTYVHLYDVAKYYGLRFARDDDHLMLGGVRRRLDFYVNKRVAYIDGYKVDLAHTAKKDQGAYFISEADFTLLIDPAYRDWGLKRQNIQTIVIDPGHGGHDQGASKYELAEKDIVLKVGLRLKRILEKQGYRVVMTRSTDRFISLTNRGKSRGDLFISLHCNAAAATSAGGMETWYVAPRHTMSSRTAGLVYKDRVPGNRFDRLNQRLALEIQRYTLNATGQTRDRGLKRARFQVLRQADMPAVLVELGFISNRREAVNLSNSAYQQKLAVGIANGIISYHQAVAPPND